MKFEEKDSPQVEEGLRCQILVFLLSVLSSCHICFFYSQSQQYVAWLKHPFLTIFFMMLEFKSNLDIKMIPTVHVWAIFSYPETPKCFKMRFSSLEVLLCLLLIPS